MVVRVNEFNNKAAKEFAAQISSAHNTGQSVIPVIIDSYGGQVYSLMAMISSIKHAELPVATIIEGKAMSCGAILFSFGDEGMRFMDPDATLMIHDVSTSVWGKVEEIKADAAEAERLNQTVYRMMARNCGKKDDYFLDLIHERSHADWFLDAAEAKRHNLANQIRVPKFNITVNVNIDFE
jgi:ATP-dependent Clp protease protease subunit